MYGDKRKIIIGGIIFLTIILGLGLFLILRGGGKTSRINALQEISAQDDMLRSARNYFNQGEYQKALDILNQLLHDNPLNEDAQRLRDSILATRKSREAASRQAELDALKADNEQLRQNPDRPGETIHQKTSEEEIAGEGAKAEQKQSDEESQNQMVEALIADGRRSLRKKHYEDAIDAANAALVLAPNSNAAHALKKDAENARNREVEALIADGRGALRKKHYKDAIDAANAALALAPDSNDAYSLKKDAENARNREVEALIADGRRSLRKKHYKDAIDAANAALVLAPDSNDAYSLKKDAENARNREVEALIADGRRSLRKKHYKDAIDAANAALVLAPDSNDAYSLKKDAENARNREVEALIADGRRSLRKKHYEDAIDAANAALTLAPDSNDAYSLKKDAGNARNREARNKEVEALIADGRRSLRKKHYEDAIDAANAALALAPDSNDAYSLKKDAENARDREAQNQMVEALIADGLRSLRKKHYKDAIDAANAALALAPDSNDAHALKKDAENARDREARNKEVEALMAYGQRSLKDNHYEDAIDAANSALRISPESNAAHRLKKDAENAREAAASIAREQAKKEQELRKILDAARTAIDREQYVKARELASRARDIDPESGEAWGLEGDAWYLDDPESSDHRRQAKNAYKKALQQNPQDWNSHYRLGQIAYAEGHLEDAIVSFQKAASIRPDIADIWYGLGKAQYRSRQYTDAAGSFEKVSRIQSNYVNNWFNLGLCYTQLDRILNASEAFIQSIRLQPEHAPSHYEMGRIYLWKENWTGAVDSFSMAASLAPGDVRYWRSLGAAEYGREKYDKARIAYRKALKMDPSHGDTNYNLALIALQMDNVNEALERATVALRSNSSNAAYLYTLGHAAERAGMEDQAITAYRKSASMDPGYSKPRINLGVLYGEKGDDDQALDYLLQALGIEPNSSTVWNNLGKIYLHKKDYPNSLKYFQKATASNPDDAELQMNLALALTESGENLHAEATYTRVISLNPEQGEAYDKLARLQFASGNASMARKTVAALEKAVPEYPGLDVLKALIE